MYRTIIVRHPCPSAATLGPFRPAIVGPPMPILFWPENRHRLPGFVIASRTVCRYVSGYTRALIIHATLTLILDISKDVFKVFLHRKLIAPPTGIDRIGRPHRFGVLLGDMFRDD